ncbi:uncharacterized protein [Amphiura filiformis]|uniref:uncharacterized protein n=1 Tax=Amphiura filiformis TaxID=82378 RepID=UPI003B225B31
MPGNAPFCSPKQLTQCYYAASLVLAANRRTVCSCPEVCYETLYKPTVSQTSFPSRGVARSLYFKQDFDLPAQAFAEALLDVTVNHNRILQDTVLLSIASGIMQTNNSNGDILSHVFPNTIGTLFRALYIDIFVSMQYLVYVELAEDLFYQIYLGNVNYAPGGERYWQEYFKNEKHWVTSGVYKQVVAQAFKDTGEYLPHLGNQTFDEFIDDVYEEFGFEQAYFNAFPLIYTATYDMLTLYGNEVNLNNDRSVLLTEYMRKNILQVEIFYGNLKVEQIAEQPSYELFQFVCDLGGALGLFFGASLLSFIETIDFWFSHACVRSSKKNQADNKLRNEHGTKNGIFII